jgi:hypothetical protein
MPSKSCHFARAGGFLCKQEVTGSIPVGSIHEVAGNRLVLAGDRGIELAGPQLMEAFWKPPRLISPPLAFFSAGAPRVQTQREEGCSWVRACPSPCTPPRPIWARAWMPAVKSDVTRPRRPDVSSLVTRLNRPQGEDGRPDETRSERFRVNAPTYVGQSPRSTGDHAGSSTPPSSTTSSPSTCSSVLASGHPHRGNPITRGRRGLSLARGSARR